LQLKPPSWQELETLIRSRLRPLLADLREIGDLPGNFPFSSKFLADLTGLGSANLRSILIRLRDEYSRVVYSRTPGPTTIPNGEIGPGKAPPPDPNWTTVLESAWKKGCEAARKNWQLGPLVHQDLHACLGGLLQAALPIDVDKW